MKELVYEKELNEHTQYLWRLIDKAFYNDYPFEVKFGLLKKMNEEWNYAEKQDSIIVGCSRTDDTFSFIIDELPEYMS